MAELCDSSQVEKKKYYMEVAESLLIQDGAMHDAISESDMILSENEHLHSFYSQYEKFLIGNSSKENYNLYLNYCKENDIIPFGKLSFSRRMCEYFSITSINKRVPGIGQTRVWVRSKDKGELNGR